MSKMTEEKRKRRENRQAKNIQNIKQNYKQIIDDVKKLSEKVINKNILGISELEIDLRTFIDNFSRIKNANFNEQKSILKSAKDIKYPLLLITNIDE